LLDAAGSIAAKHGRASWRAPDARPPQDP
jgi:hypothetical protein